MQKLRNHYKSETNMCTHKLMFDMTSFWIIIFSLIWKTFNKQHYYYLKFLADKYWKRRSALANYLLTRTLNQNVVEQPNTTLAIL